MSDADQRVGDGVPIVFSKVHDLNTIRDHPIFEGYCAEGLMFVPPVAGKSFSFLRTNRNGMNRLGVFTTTIVENVEQLEDGSMKVSTRNSVYHLTFVLDPVS